MLDKPGLKIQKIGLINVYHLFRAADCPKQFKEYKVTCNQERYYIFPFFPIFFLIYSTRCYDEEMLPEKAAASKSKPAKRWSTLGKKDVPDGTPMGVDTIGNVGEGQFFEDSFKNWISEGQVVKEVKSKALAYLEEGTFSRIME